MTTLTPVEINSCRAIAALLLGHRRETIEHAIRAARNKAIADALTAGWDLPAASDRGFALPLLSRDHRALFLCRN